LLVVPTFYFSIESARDRMFAKTRRRAARFNIVVALLLTTVEVLLTLTLVRFVFRSLKKALRFAMGGGNKDTVALEKA